jgi:hypothetical protein
MVSSNFDEEIARLLRQVYELDPKGLNAISIGSGDYNQKPKIEHL